MLPVTFICIDSGLGKVDLSMLNDQTRMELTIAGLTDDTQEEFHGEDGAFRDACKWETTTCDKEGNVTAFRLECVFQGTLSLDYLPQSIRDVRISCNSSLAGTLDTAALPSGLEVFHLDDNYFEGSVNMRTIPKAMQHFDIQLNNFSGECDLCALPPNIQEFRVNENEFSGSLRLDSLPESLITLDLSNNAFAGEISLDKLPKNLAELHLHSNKLSGSLILRKLGGLYEVSAHENDFSGTAVISSELLRFDALTLRDTKITSVVTESGKVHAFEKELLPGS